jgi:transposase
MGRPTKQTANRTDAFGRFIRKGVSVGQAAQAIGVSRETVYAWRDNDPAFRAA